MLDVPPPEPRRPDVPPRRGWVAPRLTEMPPLRRLTLQGDYTGGGGTGVTPTVTG